VTVARSDALSRYLRLVLDTLQDRHGNHARQLIVSMRLRELYCPTRNWL
jgi:hypothetical protein